jgi:hypothetical protein
MPRVVSQCQFCGLPLNSCGTAPIRPCSSSTALPSKVRSTSRVARMDRSREHIPCSPIVCDPRAPLACPRRLEVPALWLRPCPGPRACRNRELFLNRRAISPNLTRTSAIPSGRLTELIDRMPPGRTPKKAYRNTDTTAATEARRKRKEPDEDTPRRTIIPTRPRCARLPEPISPSFSIASTAVGTP